MNLNATILGQAIAFVIFILYCMKKIWPPLIATIENRKKKIDNDLASVKVALKNLDIAQAEANNNLNKIKIKAQAIIQQAQKHRDKVIHDAKKSAEAESKKILAQAYSEIDLERARAREELRKQISMLALACAEKMIDRSIDKDIDSEIVDKIIAKL